MRRAVGLVVLACLLAVSAALAVTTAGAAPSSVAISSVNASVDQPAPGEPVTVTMEVRNPESTDGEIRITSAQIRKAGSATRYAYANDIGALAPGESVEIPLTVTFDEAGDKHLAAWVTVQSPNNSINTAKSPFFLDVSEPDDAALSFESPAEIDPVAGEETEINVSVSNGASDRLSNVRISLDGDARVANTERVTAALESGARADHAYQVTFPEAGQSTLDATVTYQVAGGGTRTVTREITTDVDAPTVDTELSATAARANGSSVIEATITEYGNVELRDGHVRAVVDGTVVARALLPDVPPDEGHTVTLDGSDIPPGEVSIVGEYTAAGERRTAETTVDYSPQRAAEITLSSVEATQRGARVTLSGDAANLGGDDAQSVIVSVEQSAGVTPAAPNREYFIGRIPTSEFDTFELTADVSPNAETVPVRIDYSVDGERYSQTVDVDVSGASMAPAVGEEGQGEGPDGPGGQSGGGGGLPLVQIVIVLVVLGGLFLAYRWRKQ